MGSPSVGHLDGCGRTGTLPGARWKWLECSKTRSEVIMRFDGLSFGSIRIDGETYDHDVVIEAGKIRKRKKKPSKKFREQFGHTPLSVEEDIPWNCRRLVIGTGNGALPVMDEVRREAERRKVELIVLPTLHAIGFIRQNPDRTNAILHVTC